jgi:hypothetical protein
MFLNIACGRQMISLVCAFLIVLILLAMPVDNCRR